MFSKLRLFGALLLAIAVGVASGTAMSSGGSPLAPVAPNGAETEDRSANPVAGSQAVEGNIADPGGEDAWAVRRYRGETGLTCVMVGQRRGSAFGRTTNGRFLEAPEDVPAGVCGSLDDMPLQAIVNVHKRATSDGTRFDRSVLYGAVSKKVVSITANGPDGERSVAIGPRRTFVSVYQGDHGFEDIAVTLTNKDGTSTTLKPNPPNGGRGA